MSHHFRNQANITVLNIGFKVFLKVGPKVLLEDKLLSFIKAKVISQRIFIVVANEHGINDVW